MFQGGANGTTETTIGRVTAEVVRDAADHVAAIIEALDPDDVLYSESVEVFTEFSRLGRLANAGATLVARRVDESRRWAKAGHRTVDDFIAAETGESLGDARKQRQTSERLRNLPGTEEELRKGNLSREQSDVISDAATANPGAEDRLLDDAKKKSVKDLKDQANRAKAAADRDPEATAKRIHRERKLSDQAERHAYRWDALIVLARRGLDQPNGPAPESTDKSGQTADGGPPRPKKPTNPASPEAC